jgi:uncharacterized protein (DUF697 family)/predicted GTPase
MTTPSPFDEFIRHEFMIGGKEETAQNRPINLIVAGKLGVGKSTLVNTIFGRKIAETGEGPSITEHIRRYDDPDLPISVYDTPGIKLNSGNVADIAGQYRRVLAENQADPDRRIHFALYCVAASPPRFEEHERLLIEQLSRDVAVALVITQVRTPHNKKANALREYIDGLGMPIMDGHSFLTLATPIEPDDEGESEKPAFGMEELVLALSANLGDAERFSFGRYQQVSLDLKVRQAQSIIATASATAVGIAAIPIPLLDAFPLAATQLAMLGRITVAMGLKVDPKAVATALAALTVVSGLARTGVSFLKVLFPGVGSVINGMVAGAITTSLGNAYLGACRRIAQRKIDGEQIADDDVTGEVLREFRKLARP